MLTRNVGHSRFEVLIDNGGTPGDPSDDVFLAFLGDVRDPRGLYYDDVDAAIDWLCGAFGFTELYRYGPPDHTVGAFLAVGESSVALSEARVGQSPDWDDNADLRPPRGDFVTGGVSVRVPDVDAHYDRATAFGARTFGPPTTYRFGERQYTAEDLAGHRWSFTQSVADIAPEDWGATLPS